MILTKCGYRCDLCLAYKKNIEKEDNRKVLSDGWFKYFGFRIDPVNIMCEGCVSCDDPKLIDDECPVRPCVVSKNIDNCAYCNDYICDKLLSRIVDYKEKINFNHSDIPYDDYKFIVEPYESKKRLERIRDKLKLKYIKKAFKKRFFCVLRIRNLKYTLPLPHKLFNVQSKV